MKHLVFVYGSLKKGYHNHRYIEGARLLAIAKTLHFHLLCDFGRYPAMFEKAGPTKVTGELWEISEAQREKCDWLEGHPRLYRRIPIKVTVEYDGDHTNDLVGKEIDCETYFYQGEPRGTICEEGIWAPKLLQMS